MIFVTVGTQLPFDRLIRYIDNIAPELAVPVFAQIGTTTYQPQHIEWSTLVSGAEFNALMARVTVIVAHAGIGTIIAAQQHRKPLILVPRLARHGEHRNDHQIATVASLRGRRGVYVAETEDELRERICSRLDPPDPAQSNESRGRIISAVSRRIHSIK